MAGLLTLNFDSINHYLVPCRAGWLLVDPGWAGSLPRLRSALKRYGVEPAAIKYVMMTHHHPDHAGLTQEVKVATGARLLIHEQQARRLPDLLGFYREKGGYLPIVVGPGDIRIGEKNRATFQSIGIQGELVPTPGHSDDSVTLILDDGSALIGDLGLPQHVGPELQPLTQAIWRRLIGMGARTFYPAHREPIPAASIERLLIEP